MCIVGSANPESRIVVWSCEGGGWAWAAQGEAWGGWAVQRSGCSSYASGPRGAANQESGTIESSEVAAGAGGGGAESGVEGGVEDGAAAQAGTGGGGPGVSPSSGSVDGDHTCVDSGSLRV